MDEAIAWSTRAGVEKLVLSVYPHNEAAIGLYRSCGFVEEDGSRGTRASPVTRTRYSWRPGSGRRVSAREASTGRRTVRIGLLGSGTVGAAVIRLLHEHGDDVARRAGVHLEVVRVAVRDPGRDRGLPLAADRFTDDAGAVVDDPTIDIICELMGGVEPARGLLVRAREREVRRHGEQGAPGIARRGAVHRRRGGRRRSLFRGSRGRRHPLIRPLRESLAGERVDGSSASSTGRRTSSSPRCPNTGGRPTKRSPRRSDSGSRKRIRPPTWRVRRGGEVRDPRLGRVRRGSWPTTSTARVSAVTPQDFRDAARLGYVIKLLAIAELDDEAIAVRVHPAMIPDVHRSPRFRARRTRSSSRDRRSGS